jgi:glycosyltransferase involved in cell wall biosynthesis
MKRAGAEEANDTVPMKFALLSHTVPPSWGGQSMMLFQLLRGIDPGQYCLITAQQLGTGFFKENFSHRLPVNYHHLPDDSQLRRGYRFGLSRVRETVNFPVRAVSRARRIAEILRRENCRAIVGCTGDLFDLPAAYLASRIVGVPFYAYYFDYYSYQHLDPLARFFAQRVEPFVLRGAAGVIAPNEILQDDLKRRYGIASTLVRNPCDLSLYETAESPLAADAPAGEGDEVKIVYTGAVYDAHYDAFRNLIAAIESLGRPDVKLHLYSASPVDWESVGIRGPVVHHGHQHLSAMPAIQRSADVLFLPLAFDSPYPELVKTSATSKLSEYLASGRPTLVHAPEDCFVSWYFRRHDCGVVVDRQNTAELAQAIERLATDFSLRRRLGEQAWRQARADFNVPKAQAALAGLLGVKLLQSGAESVGVGR